MVSRATREEEREEAEEEGAENREGCRLEEEELTREWRTMNEDSGFLLVRVRVWGSSDTKRRTKQSERVRMNVDEQHESRETTGKENDGKQSTRKCDCVTIEWKEMAGRQNRLFCWTH